MVVSRGRKTRQARETSCRVPDRAPVFFGWHRHKLKWLDADRKAYLTKSGNSLELTPLSASSGVSMVVVPVDDPARPSKVFVIEVAQPLQPKKGMEHKAEGMLVYSVDATLASGQNPVVVYPLPRHERCGLSRR